MAITTNAELETAVANWLDRTDLTSRIPEFVALAEARLNRMVRAPEMLTKNDSFSVTGQYVATPTGFLDAKRFSLLTSPIRQLTFLSPAAMDEARMGYPASGVPQYFSVIGTNFEFLPTPDSTYTASLVYYTKLTPNATSANWLFTAHPDIYLYGALVAAEPFLRNDERVVLWKTLFDQGIAELNIASERKSVSGTARPRTGGFE